jgi:ABC exporter DevB family membrane fusion protein
MWRMALLIMAIGGVATLGTLLDARSTALAPATGEPVARDRIFASGIVEGATENIELRPQLAGRLVEVLVRPGDQVEKDAPLVRLDDREYRQQVELAAAQLELAQSQLARLQNGHHEEERRQAAAEVRAKIARLKQAKRAWDRIEQLRRESAVAQQQADDYQYEYETMVAQVEAAQARQAFVEAPPRADELRQARAKVKSAEAELELARITLDRCTLKSPCRARILDVDVEPGELVGPECKETPIILADTNQLRIRAFVEELDAPRVQVGQPATVTADGLSGQTFTGQVTHLSPRMTFKPLTTDAPGERLDTKTREVWITLNQPSPEMVVGLRVDVMLEPQPAAN